MKSLLDKINAKLNAQGGFLKAISVLVGGTAFAQGVSVLALPFLTRLYSPKDFALFAVYASLLGMLSVASCLRFEIAIPIPEDDNEAVHLVILGLVSNLIISFIIGLIVWIFHTNIIVLIKQPDFALLLWLVPIGVFFSGVYNTLQYWTTRKKQFSIIAKTRMVQSVSGTSIQIAMGVIGLSALGLIIGQIIKVSAGIRRLAVSFGNEAGTLVKKITSQQLKQTFKKNDKFPKYSTFEAFVNAVGTQLPIIMIAALSIGSEAGYLMLAMQLLMIPMVFIGGAVSQVYLAHAPEKYHSGKLRKYTYQCIFQLIKVGIIPLVVICILAPMVIPYIFGAVWQRTGEMMLWMLPWFIMQLIVSPISMALHITDHQRIALILQIIGLIIRVGGVWLFSLYSINYIFEYYAFSSFLFYSIYFIVVCVIINLSHLNFNYKKTNVEG